MTREQLLKHWAVIEAFRNGKMVQARSSNTDIWYDVINPEFASGQQYRIKPETKKIWANVYRGQGHPSREVADQAASSGRIACVEVTYTEGEGL